jgi:hypothetical protein
MSRIRPLITDTSVFSYTRLLDVYDPRSLSFDNHINAQHRHHGDGKQRPHTTTNAIYNPECSN